MKSTVFLVIAPCSCERVPSFGSTYRLHLQCRSSWSQFHASFCCFLHRLTLLSWRWRRYSSETSGYLVTTPILRTSNQTFLCALISICVISQVALNAEAWPCPWDISSYSDIGLQDQQPTFRPGSQDFFPLYLGDPGFKSWPPERLSWLRFISLWFFSVPPGKRKDDPSNYAMTIFLAHRL